MLFIFIYIHRNRNLFILLLTFFLSMRIALNIKSKETVECCNQNAYVISVTLSETLIPLEKEIPFEARHSAWKYETSQ